MARRWAVGLLDGVHERRLSFCCLLQDEFGKGARDITRAQAQEERREGVWCHDLILVEIKYSSAFVGVQREQREQ